jgi:hypothetical protein
MLDGRMLAKTGHPATGWRTLRPVGWDHNRVVDDGTLVTSGGITAGIDLALHIVGRQYGADAADGLAVTMEYTGDRDILVARSN